MDVLDNGVLYLRNSAGTYAFNSERGSMLISRMIPLLREGRTRDDLLALLPAERRPELSNLIEFLVRNRFLQPRAASQALHALLLADAHGAELEQALAACPSIRELHTAGTHAQFDCIQPDVAFITDTRAAATEALCRLAKNRTFRVWGGMTYRIAFLVRDSSAEDAAMRMRSVLDRLYSFESGYPLLGSRRLAAQWLAAAVCANDVSVGERPWLKIFSGSGAHVSTQFHDLSSLPLLSPLVQEGQSLAVRHIAALTGIEVPHRPPTPTEADDLGPLIEVRDSNFGFLLNVSESGLKQLPLCRSQVVARGPGSAPTAAITASGLTYTTARRRATGAALDACVAMTLGGRVCAVASRRDLGPDARFIAGPRFEDDAVHRWYEALVLPSRNFAMVDEQAITKSPPAGWHVGCGNGRHAEAMLVACAAALVRNQVQRASHIEVCPIPARLLAAAQVQRLIEMVTRLGDRCRLHRVRNQFGMPCFISRLDSGAAFVAAGTEPAAAIEDALLAAVQQLQAAMNGEAFDTVSYEIARSAEVSLCAARNDDLPGRYEAADLFTALRVRGQSCLLVPTGAIRISQRDYYAAMLLSAGQEFSNG
ncbi:MAG: hypothetical protein KGJ75_05135 [Alphaproteobacteria bacterium]|nr:hypothetical protein [Alphaproteobacteria bacterium]